MENFKAITEHRLNAGEIGVHEGVTYIVLENPSLLGIRCDECDLCNIDCSDVVCDFDVYFKRHIVDKKKDIDLVSESIDDTSNDGSDPIERITIPRSEYMSLLQKASCYNEIKNLIDGRYNNSQY